MICMLFWGAVCISLRPLMADRALNIERGFTSNKAITKKARFKTQYILATVQSAIHIMILLRHIFGYLWMLVLLGFGMDVTLASSIPTCPKGVTTNTDEPFLARLNAALNMRNLWRKGYTLIATISTSAVNAVQVGETIH